jgi:hypothetical protein
VSGQYDTNTVASLKNNLKTISLVKKVFADLQGNRQVVLPFGKVDT